MRILLRRLLKLSPNVPVSRDSQIYGAGVKATQKISTKKKPRRARLSNGSGSVKIYCAATTQFGIDRAALEISPLGVSMMRGVAQLNVLLAYCGRLLGENFIDRIA